MTLLGRGLFASAAVVASLVTASLIPTLRPYLQEAGIAAAILWLLYESRHVTLRRLEKEKRHIAEMADLHLRTIEALALAIDAKDYTTHEHLHRVKVYATEVGKELGFTGGQMQALEAAALLHDIGKLAVPEYIISKPGKLTPEEFEKMKIHPAVGAEILERVCFPYPVAPMVRSHHERWDGTGYPDGLKGEAIPPGARILAVVDCFDALASDRQYRRAYPLRQALEMVRSQAGTSFDPRVVEVLARRYTEFEQLARATPVTRLSAAARVPRGAGEPGAGYEVSTAMPPGETPADFVGSIASARQEFHLLVDILNDLGSSLSIDETLSLLATRLKPMIPHDAVAIYTLRKDMLVLQYLSGEESVPSNSLEIPIGQGLSGWVAENRRPIVNGNPSVEPAYLNGPGKLKPMLSALSVPLEGVAGVAGVITLYHSALDAFTRDHLRILLAISSKAGLAIENALKFRQVESSAVTDELTSLANARSLFLQLDSELALAKRANVSLAVLVLDLDGFKQINDRFGHLTGNKVLQVIAKGLSECCREYDFVARMGGDEFVILLPGSSSGAAKIKEAAFQAITRDAGWSICGEDLLSASVGEASFPADGATAEQLLAVADQRMYGIKRSRHAGEPVVPLADIEMTTASVH